jgi:hypothetical protein
MLRTLHSGWRLSSCKIALREVRRISIVWQSRRQASTHILYEASLVVLVGQRCTHSDSLPSQVLPLLVLPMTSAFDNRKSRSICAAQKCVSCGLVCTLPVTTLVVRHCSLSSFFFFWKGSSLLLRSACTLQKGNTGCAVLSSFFVVEGAYIQQGRFFFPPWGITAD